MGLLSGIFGGGKKTEGEKQLAKLTQLQVENARMIRQGMANPEFAAMVSEHVPRIKADYINALNQMFIQSARNQARGGPGAFAVPERRDEFMAANKAQGFLDANQQARDYARQLLQASSGMAAAGAGSASQGAQLETGRAMYKDQLTGALINAGLGMVGGYMGFPGGGSFASGLGSWLGGNTPVKPGG